MKSYSNASNWCQKAAEQDCEQGKVKAAECELFIFISRAGLHIVAGVCALKSR